MRIAAHQHRLFYERRDIVDLIREYLIRVTAAALICGVATKLIHKGVIGSVIKLSAGIFMALTVISPLINIQLDSIADFTFDIQSAADAAAAEGEISAREAMAQIISEQTAAYILNKAETLGAMLTVEVTVSEDEYQIPSAVKIEGSVSPYAKSVLSAYISENLGISTEEQTWIS